MPHSFSLAVSMNLEHSIKEGSHERYPVHLQCLRNIKKIKYPDFQAMTLRIGNIYTFLLQQDDASSIPVVPQLSQRPLISVECLPDMPSIQAVAKYLQDISPPVPKRAPTAALGALTSTGNLISFLLHISPLYPYTV